MTEAVARAALLGPEDAERIAAAHPDQFTPGSTMYAIEIPTTTAVDVSGRLESIVTAGMTAIADDAESYRRFVGAITPTRPAGRGLLLQAHRYVSALQDLDNEFGEYSSAEVARLTRSTAKNPAATAARWLAQKRILAVPGGNGSNRFPGFQFGPGGQPIPVIAEVIAVLDTHLDPAALALWFVGNNGWLDGDRPVDLLETEPAEVVQAAKELAAQLT